MFPIIIAVIVLLVTGCIIRSVTKPKNFPPGPKWYPLFGCSTIVQKYTKVYGSQWKGLSQLAKEYSTQVLGIKLGLEPIVVVFGQNNIRRVFMEKEFEGRPNSFFIRLRCLGKRMGITFADGELWKEHRQFTVKHLKNVGFGKTAMEVEIKKELRSILDYINRHKSKPINPKTILAMSVMNILWKFTAGERIKEDRLNFLLDLLSARSRAFSMAGGWLNQWPWIRFLLPELSGFTLIKEMNKQISDIIEETIARHKSKTINGDDFMYSFLDEMNGKTKESFTEEQLKIICLDILIAGSQTTSNVLEFAILTVLRNKVVQEKIFEEISNVLGHEPPSWADSSRLVYTMAFLLEVQRYFTIVPLAGPRRVLEDVNMDGYFIPKDTTILSAVGDLHFDPDIWEHPDKFIPERFIDERGNIKNTEQMYPFGIGRRRCPGDSLAKSFIFIVFVGIMQSYRIECSNGVLPSEEPLIGLISSARPYNAEFVARQ
ncbi:probable cytochrome P450 305a1 [Maniola hyperantus]|uniref:probable cytochrome P450 305a1 n=1 Tax=Aphantopus hyperantus TaxID=2795564 RepID=UPI0015697E4E|nr:probable cytochrome P450 305a1 [Maniola hyperantus]